MVKIKKLLSQFLIEIIDKIDNVLFNIIASCVEIKRKAFLTLKKDKKLAYETTHLYRYFFKMGCVNFMYGDQKRCEPQERKLIKME